MASKIFTDHITLSNLNSYGVKQILYPTTTSDDVLIENGTDGVVSLTNYFSGANTDITFKKAANTDSTKGIAFIDPDNNKFLGISQNASNLWIGAKTAQSYHHNGALFISSGWDSSNNTGYETVWICSPTSNSTNSNNTYINFKVLHTGNSGNYDIGFENMKGVNFKDTVDEEYVGIYNNASNLWIGAGRASTYHHFGDTIISAGWHSDYVDGHDVIEKKNSWGDRWGENPNSTWTGNRSIYISVPKFNPSYIHGGSNPIMTADSYEVTHAGIIHDHLINTTDMPSKDCIIRAFYDAYNGIYTFNLNVSGDTVKLDSVPLITTSGNNIWIGASSSRSYHHYGKTIISAGWNFYNNTYGDTDPTDDVVYDSVSDLRNGTGSAPSVIGNISTKTLGEKDPYENLAVYLKGNTTAYIAVPKFNSNSSFTPETPSGGFNGSKPIFANDSESYGILHSGNFSTYFLQFCSDHATAIKSALGIS